MKIADDTFETVNRIEYPMQAQVGGWGEDKRANYSLFWAIIA
jgi:hypothetical protein